MNEEYPVEEQVAAPKKTYKDHLREWITSDCRNKFCIDGGVSIDDGQYVTHYRCPLCNRTPVPSASLYTGPIEEWTDAEMAARLKDRKDVYFDREYRYRRGMEIMALLKSLTYGAGKNRTDRVEKEMVPIG